MVNNIGIFYCRVIDDGNNRHHLILSTAYRTTSSTQLHAKIALGMLVKAKVVFKLILFLQKIIVNFYLPEKELLRMSLKSLW